VLLRQEFWPEIPLPPVGLEALGGLMLNPGTNFYVNVALFFDGSLQSDVAVHRKCGTLRFTRNKKIHTSRYF